MAGNDTMALSLRLIVGGLPSGLTEEQLQALLYPVSDLHLCEEAGSPGNGAQAFVIAQLGANRMLATRLRDRLDRKRLQEHRLWAFVAVLPWT